MEKIKFLSLNFGDLFYFNKRYWAKTQRTAATNVSGGDHRCCSFSENESDDCDNPEVLFIPNKIVKRALDKELDKYLLEQKEKQCYPKNL